MEVPNAFGSAEQEVPTKISSRGRGSLVPPRSEDDAYASTLDRFRVCKAEEPRNAILNHSHTNERNVRKMSVNKARNLRASPSGR